MLFILSLLIVAANILPAMTSAWIYTHAYNLTNNAQLLAVKHQLTTLNLFTAKKEGGQDVDTSEKYGRAKECPD